MIEKLNIPDYLTYDEWFREHGGLIKLCETVENIIDALDANETAIASLRHDVDKLITQCNDNALTIAGMQERVEDCEELQEKVTGILINQKVFQDLLQALKERVETLEKKKHRHFVNMHGQHQELTEPQSTFPGDNAEAQGVIFQPTTAGGSFREPVETAKGRWICDACGKDWGGSLARPQTGSPLPCFDDMGGCGEMAVTWHPAENTKTDEPYTLQTYTADGEPVSPLGSDCDAGAMKQNDISNGHWECTRGCNMRDKAVFWDPDGETYYHDVDTTESRHYVKWILDTPELKPCPFCHGDGQVYDWIDTSGINAGERIYTVECDNCGARGEEMLTKAEAIAAWNRRASDGEIATLKAENEELTAARERIARYEEMERRIRKWRKMLANGVSAFRVDEILAALKDE